MRLGESLQVAVTYIGAIIGAGFASGQEILQFFVIYGNNGLLGIILSGILFGLLGISIIYISYELQVTNYQQLFYKVGGKKIGFLADLILTLFLLGSLIVMIAGSKEIFNQFFNFRINLGLLLTIMIIVLANYYGLEGIMNLNLILIPLLIFIIFFVTNNLIDNFKFKVVIDSFNLDWILSSFIYTGYNLILGLTVLLPLTGQINKKELILGISSGGLLLGGIAFLIGYTLNQFYPQIVSSQIPMLDIVTKYQSRLYYIYSTTLWLAMLTTASCNLYALVTRLNSSIKLSKIKSLSLILILILPFIKIPFSRLVELIYPQLGKLSLGLISFLIIKYLVEKIYEGRDKNDNI